MYRNASPSLATARVQPAECFLQLDDARLHYRDEGQGPAVLLVHGWTLDLEMWDPQAQALQDAFRVVRVDRRGFGLSSGVPAPERDAADLATLCAHLGLSSVALIGMSQGARSVLEFATAGLTPVSALILDGPPALQRSEGDDDVPVARYRALLRAEGIEAVRSEWSRHALTQLHTSDPRTRALLRRMLQRYTGVDLLRTSPNVAAGEVLRRLRSVGTPTLLVNGEWDLPARLQSADTLASLLPCAERALIAGAGHLPNLDNPDLYNSVCRTFLTRHTASCNLSRSDHG